MGWKGALRSIAAAQRRYEREAVREQRELERRRLLTAKMLDKELAALEVEEYENRLALLLSTHKECNDPWNWQAISRQLQPARPSRKTIHEDSALATLNTYRPSAIDKVLGKAKSKQEELVKAVKNAQLRDESEYQEALGIYRQRFAEWEEQVALAKLILQGDRAAYIEAIQQVNPFAEIGVLGSEVRFSVETGELVCASLEVNGESVIPKETKSLLKSGKVSSKEMPKTKFYELYQDHVCSCVLRIARELFALLPINMVIVSAEGEVLNSVTGHLEVKTILSVAIPRQTLAALKFDTIDPSDSLSNFVHRIGFKRGQGFSEISKIQPNELEIN